MSSLVLIDIVPEVLYDLTEDLGESAVAPPCNICTYLKSGEFSLCRYFVLVVGRIHGGQSGLACLANLLELLDVASSSSEI
jgi:hypothetical protein